MCFSLQLQMTKWRKCWWRQWRSRRPWSPMSVLDFFTWWQNRKKTFFFYVNKCLYSSETSQSQRLCDDGDGKRSSGSAPRRCHHRVPHGSAPPWPHQDGVWWARRPDRNTGKITKRLKNSPVAIFTNASVDWFRRLTLFHQTITLHKAQEFGSVVFLVFIFPFCL